MTDPTTERCPYCGQEPDDGEAYCAECRSLFDAVDAMAAAAYEDECEEWQECAPPQPGCPESRVYPGLRYLTRVDIRRLSWQQ